MYIKSNYNIFRYIYGVVDDELDEWWSFIHLSSLKTPSVSLDLDHVDITLLNQLYICDIGGWLDSDMKINFNIVALI